MSRPRYQTPWLPVRGGAPRLSFPRHRGTLEADVVIVGGGAVGCLTAYLFVRAGHRTVLLEADRLAGAASSGATGLIVPGTGGSFLEVRQRLGLRAARHVWEASRRAGLELAALLRRLGIQCGLVAREHLDVALESAPAAALERDYRELTGASLDASWLPARRVRALLHLDGVALRVKGGASLDPWRATIGVARHAQRHGAALFERSPVTRIKRGKKTVEVVTDAGSVTAPQVVVATGLPRPGFRQLARHLSEVDEFAVQLPPLSAALRRAMAPTGVSVRKRADSPHTWHWTRDERLVFEGAAAPPVPARQRDAALVQRTGQLMYELSCLYPDVSGTQAEYGWAARTVVTADGLPVAGSHRNYPRHLFGVSPGAAGLGTAFLVAKTLLRQYEGAPEKGDEALGFLR